VVAIVHDVTQIPPENLTPEVDLRADLGVDSILGLQIVAVIEKRFGIRVPDEELGVYTRVGEIAETVARLQSEQGAESS
jgi:acyl carrier protein